MSDFSPGDLLADPARAGRAFEFLDKLSRARIALPGGREYPLQIIPGARNSVFDIRGLSANGVANSIVFPPGTDGYVLFSDSSDPTGFTWVDLGTELTTWIARVEAAGGTFTLRSKGIAAKLLRGIREATYNSKIVSLWPFLGGNIPAACVPIRDRLGVGSAVNHNFINADFTETSGLQGNGTTKYLDAQVTPADLGVGNNGGMGWWEANFQGSSVKVQPMGCYGSGGANQMRYVIDLRTTLTRGSWGNIANGASVSVTATNSHYYVQRSSATSRTFYKDGALVATNTTSDSAANSSDNSILLCGADEGNGGIVPWPGRGACTYFTDGTMTSGEIAAFHTLLDETLVTPLGR
jgi:hypothetical protein